MVSREELLREVEILENKIQDLVWKFEEKYDTEVFRIHTLASDSDEESAIPVIDVILLEEAQRQ